MVNTKDTAVRIIEIKDDSEHHEHHHAYGFTKGHPCRIAIKPKDSPLIGDALDRGVEVIVLIPLDQIEAVGAVNLN